jgi:magnesium chelatase subunit D
VLPLALAHRSREKPRTQRPPPPPPNPQPDRDRPRESATDEHAPPERVFAALDVNAPRIVADHQAPRAGVSARALGASNGPAVGSRLSVDPAELDVRSTVLHAMTHTGLHQIRRDDLHERVRQPVAGTRYIFVVDSSGSHAAQNRMRLVKGAVSGLLDASHGRRDEVVAISCRGAAAQVLLEPTHSLEDAARALEYLPTGGRTPLAHALELAARYVNAHAVVIVLTDGRANVPRHTDDAWADALQAAGALGCPALVIDTEDSRRPTGRPTELAEAMGANRVRLTDLDQSTVIRLIRDVS